MISCDCMKRLTSICAILVLCVIVGAPAADWPVARGDAASSGVAKSPLAEPLDLAWKYQASADAAIEATPVIADGVVYVGDTEGIFHAVKLASGEAVWTKKFDDAIFTAAAAVLGDKVFVADLNGIVRCLSTVDGSEMWQRSVDSEVHAGLTIHSDSVLVTTEAGKFHRLDAATGEPKWEAFQIEAPLRSSATVIGNWVLLAGCDEVLHAVDVETGQEVATARIDGPTGCTPGLSSGHVYFGTESGSFYCIAADPEKKTLEVVWTFRDPQRRQGIRTAAAVNGPLAVFGSQGKAVYAIDASSGEQKWKLPQRTRVESSPVIAGERVIVGTMEGRLYLLAAANGETKWEYDAGGSFQSSPAVVDGHVVIGNENGTLYCFAKP